LPAICFTVKAPGEPGSKDRKLTPRKDPCRVIGDPAGLKAVEFRWAVWVENGMDASARRQCGAGPMQDAGLTSGT